LQEGGDRPVWDQTLEFDIYSRDDFLTLSCYDEDVSSHDKLGRAKLKVTEVCSKNEKRQWVSLMAEGKLATELLVITKFLPDDEITKSRPTLKNRLTNAQ
jgi:Ca2+-dependent lipid-binding protein